MKAPLFFLLLAAASATAAPASTGASTASTTQAQSATRGEEALPSALMRLPFLQGKPDLQAKYYVYVQSASWCGPCRKYMPVIVDLYDRLKQAGVEVILVGRDSTEKATAAYAKSHKVTFPVLQGDPGLEASLPGFGMAKSIPHIQVVDRDGAVLLSGHPQHFFTGGKWKDLLEQWKTAPVGSIEADMDDENGRYEIVIRNVEDMDDMLHTMANHMRSSQKFQSRIPSPESMVLSTAVGNDIMAGFGITAQDGQYTLTPAYLDSWRMLHAFLSKNSVASVPGADGGWGNRPTKGELDAMAALKAHVQKLVRPGMSESAIVLAIHDDLVNRATYRQDGPTTATHMIQNREGAADAYTRYMYLALNMAGIPCHRVVGTDAFHHSWLLVNIEKRWYHLDTAWDDPAATTADGTPHPILSHAYCCVSDATMAKDHQWNRSVYPEAKQDYPFPFRKTITSPQTLQAALKQAFRSGAATFEAILAFPLGSTLKASPAPIDSYAVTDPQNGYIVVYFDRAESGAAPVEIKLSPKSTDSPSAAARWHNIRLGK